MNIVKSMPNYNNYHHNNNIELGPKRRFFTFVRPAFTKLKINVRIKQASFWSKFKVILMVVVIVWHRFDNIHSKGNLMLYEMHINIQKISVRNRLQYCRDEHGSDSKPDRSRIVLFFVGAGLSEL